MLWWVEKRKLRSFPVQHFVCDLAKRPHRSMVFNHHLDPLWKETLTTKCTKEALKEHVQNIWKQVDSMASIVKQHTTQHYNYLAQL